MTQTQTDTRNITLTQALNEAMREEMRRDERVFIMGEDIQSGVYGASGGLFAEFGGERVRDCPLSENAFFGAAVGAAVQVALARRECVRHAGPQAETRAGCGVELPRVLRGHGQAECKRGNVGKAHQNGVGVAQSADAERTWFDHERYTV